LARSGPLAAPKRFADHYPSNAHNKEKWLERFQVEPLLRRMGAEPCRFAEELDLQSFPCYLWIPAAKGENA